MKVTELMQLRDAAVLYAVAADLRLSGDELRRMFEVAERLQRDDVERLRALWERTRHILDDDDHDTRRLVLR